MSILVSSWLPWAFQSKLWSPLQIQTHLHAPSKPAGCLTGCCAAVQATGWSKRFSIKASSRDMASQSWKKVTGAVEAAGYAPSALCAAPQAHCVGAGGGNCYLLGLPHLKALYIAADLLERWAAPRIHPLGCCPFPMSLLEGDSDRPYNLLCLYSHVLSGAFLKGSFLSKVLLPCCEAQMPDSQSF